MTEVSVREKPVVAVKENSPATSITVPVGPTLVTVGNIAVTSMALAVSSGVAGPIVAVAAAATGLAMVRHHQSRRPGARTFGTKRGGSASRSGRSSGGFGKRGSVAGGLGSKLGRMGRRLGGRAGRSLADSRIGRAARRAGKALSPVGRAVRGVSRGVDKAFRGASAGLGKAGKAVGSFGRFGRRMLRPGEHRRKNIDTSRDKRNNKRKVGPTVNEPPERSKGPQKPQKPPTKPPVKDVPVSKGNGPSGNKGPLFSGSQLAELAKSFASQAQNIKHRGHLETLSEANDMPAVLSLFADTFRSRLDEYKRSSIHPDYVQAYSTLCEALETISGMSRQLAPTFMDLHGDLVRNLVNSPDPSTWDTTNNGV